MRKHFKVKVTFEDGSSKIYRDIEVSDFAMLKLSDDLRLTMGNMTLWKRKANVILGEEVPYQSVVVLAQKITKLGK